MSVLANGPGDDSITVEATFPSPPAQGFRAWTDPGETKKWFESEPGNPNRQPSTFGQGANGASPNEPRLLDRLALRGATSRLIPTWR